MSRLAVFLIVLAAPLFIAAAPRLREPDPQLPVGKWRVEFANGVIETCEIAQDGSSSVVEPRRSSPGKWTVKDGAVLITSNDDRLERWRHVDGRWVVDHRCPVAAYPEGSPVRGVAKRTR
jgi:hypothetical protein